METLCLGRHLAGASRIALGCMTLKPFKRLKRLNTSPMV